MLSTLISPLSFQAPAAGLARPTMGVSMTAITPGDVGTTKPLGVYDPLQLMATLLILGNLVGPSPGAVLAGLAGRSGATDVFWVSLVANWRVWLPAQLLNYALVPPHLRVLFGNAVSICWNMTLAARIATGLAD